MELQIRIGLSQTRLRSISIWHNGVTCIVWCNQNGTRCHSVMTHVIFSSERIHYRHSTRRSLEIFQYLRTFCVYVIRITSFVRSILTQVHLKNGAPVVRLKRKNQFKTVYLKRWCFKCITRLNMKCELSLLMDRRPSFIYFHRLNTVVSSGERNRFEDKCNANRFVIKNLA